MATNLERIQAAIVDGRSQAPRYIQKQLTTLHAALVRSVASLHHAIVRDTECTSSEAWFEIDATIRAVKQEYSSVDFQDLLRDEYSLAHGKDNLKRRLPVGCTYIIPSSHSRLYSIVQPIAASIAAGNCVVVEMQQTLLETEDLLRKVLQQVMDKDTFAIVDQRPTQDKFFTDRVVIANASNEHGVKVSKSMVVGSPSSRTIAIVDRSANVVEAAKHLVRARFRFSGKSPYAPDLILVNEFVLKEFCHAAVKSFTEELSEAVNTTTANKSPKTTSQLKEPHQPTTTTLISGARGSIQLARSRDQKLLSRKINEPTLVINSVTSLDDAIDTSNTPGGTLLAAYIFSDPAAAKYLSQFVAADISFTNHIPSQILVGPPAPRGYTASIESRYTKEMFSFSSPEHITPPTNDVALSELLDGHLSKANLEKMKAEIRIPLPDMNEPEGKSIGFFEQGIITGLAIEGTVVVGLLAVCARYAVPAILRRVRG